jgi:hypothetical protein
MGSMFRVKPALARSQSYDALVFLSLSLWLYGPLLGLVRFFSFLILYTVGRTPWTGDQPVAGLLPAHTGQQKHRINHTDIHASSEIRTHDPSVRANKVHALDRATTVTGDLNIYYRKLKKKIFEHYPLLGCYAL